MEPFASLVFTDPTIIPDSFATGAAHVHTASDGVVRLTFYVDVEIGTIEPEHRIVDRVILPREAIPALLAMLTDAMRHHEGLATIGHRSAASH